MNSTKSIAAVAELAEYGVRLAEERRAQPGDDLTTSLVHAEVDGERLTSAEIASFFILLSAAGNETTRNAISHGMVALTRYPEEREKWWSDFDGVAATAVEEIVRWASPIIFMRRNLTQDFEMGGIEMKAGDKVSMWYNSANRDERKFGNPWLFDVTRDPNPHIGFGAGGAHFCLGANLARREIRVLFEELRRQIPDIVAVEEPAILRSAFVHGIKRLPVAWTVPGLSRHYQPRCFHSSRWAARHAAWCRRRARGTRPSSRRRRRTPGWLRRRAVARSRRSCPRLADDRRGTGSRR